MQKNTEISNIKSALETAKKCVKKYRAETKHFLAQQKQLEKLNAGRLKRFERGLAFIRNHTGA